MECEKKARFVSGPRSDIICNRKGYVQYKGQRILNYKRLIAYGPKSGKQTDKEE